MQSLLTNPSLMDCRRLFLRDYEVWINIGVHDFEKKGEQRVKINVDLYVPLAMSTPRQDKLDEVLDYDFIRRSIAERVARAVHYLLEAGAVTGTTLLVDGGQHLQAQARDVMFLAREKDDKKET